jgi:23S rRNA pseudouridine1911/1915/1917 synthase
MQELKVSKEYAGFRLDVFLRAHFLDFSRAWIQKLIKKGNAKVNDKPASASKKLTAADTVSFDAKLPPEISLEPDGSLDEKIKVIFENEDFLVIDKPSGISSHPSQSEKERTLVNWLIFHYPPIKSVGDLQDKENIRPGIVHRLDKETSGTMVIAKNQKMFLHLKKQFQNHTVEKKYIALVNGSPKEDSGKIDLNIARSKSDPTKNTTVKSKTEGRQALTYWKILKKYPDHSLLEVMPKTGRMHQIRVHLKAIGLPVSGDKKYAPAGGRGGIKSKDPKHLGRMFLHAEYLSFKNLDGEKMSFSAPIPEDLANCLRNLRFVIK